MYYFGTDIMKERSNRNAKLVRENRTLKEEVKRLTSLNDTLKTLLKEATDMLEKKCELKERMDALEARINEDKEKQAKWAQANVNWAESLTKVIIAKNKKN